MYRALALVGAVLLMAGAAFGQGLDGKRLVVKAGDVTTPNAPMSVAWEGPAPATSVDVVEEGTGKALPATVRDGELVFVPGDATPGAEHAYVVHVTAEKRPPHVMISQRGQDPILDVTVDGEPFTSYHYGIDKTVSFEAAKKLKPAITEEQFKLYDADGDGVITSKDRPVAAARRDKGEISKDDYREIETQIASVVNHKPFLWPVLGEGGVTLTRNWPMGESEGVTDHVHQKSFWTAHGNINGASWWEETYDRSGYEMVDDITWGSGDAYGWIHSKQTWQDSEHKPVVAEEREYRFYNTPASGRLFDLKVTFTAAYGDAVFGDTKEGGIASLRIRPEIQEKNGTGLVTTADGKGGNDVWGKPSAWCDYTGTIAGAGVRGMTIMDHPSNLRHPARWHVRDYGLMGANYFGLHDFDKAPEHAGDWTLKNGESATFQYRVLAHSGTPEEAKVAERYADYAKAPQATVAP